MSETIEHQSFNIWDNDWDSLGNELARAFADAGGEIEHFSYGDMIVKGLDYDTVSEICDRYGATIEGPVPTKAEPKPGYKNITPAKPIRLAK